MKLRVSIRIKLIMMIAILLAGISAFIYMYFPDKFETQVMESLVERAGSINEMTAFGVSSALFFGDEESGRESLHALESNTDLTFVAVYDENDSLFISSTFDPSIAAVDYPETEAIVFKTNTLQLITPVLNDGLVIGHVVTVFSLDAIRKSAAESRKAIAFISIIVFSLGIFAAVFLSSVITQPLRKMVKTVSRIESGDLSQRAQTGSGDEIEELAHSFNHMVESLENSYREMEEFNRTLEKHVKERTTQLDREIEIRRITEKELLYAKEYAERLVELTPIAIISIDKNQLITSWNRKAGEITGYGLREVLGRKYKNILKSNGGSPDKVLFLDSGQSLHPREISINRKDGSEIIISLAADPLYDANGRIIGGIVCFEDVTYRIRLEEELQIRQRMDSLGNLAGGIAHDFNNLLMGIMGNLDLIRMDYDGLTENHRRYVEESYSLSKRAAKLIKEIQSLSSVNLIHRKTVDIYDIAKNVFNILDEITDRLIEKKVDIAPGKYFINANEDQIHQVLLNLGTNSVNALTERGIRSGDYIRISAEEYTVGKGGSRVFKEGDYIHIMFEDNGVGMTEKVKQHAFDPLFTTSQKSARKGQGLGLAMVYNIITNNHEGYITIDSKSGEGTRINIWLEKGSGKRNPILTLIEKTDKGNGTILVVEDEYAIRDVTEKSLEMNGYRVISANDGVEGLEMFNKHKNEIDLVILDISMPRMSGYELLEKMLAEKEDIRFIISTGQSEDKVQQYKHLDRILTKPYSIPTLLSTVNNVLKSAGNTADK